MQQGSRPLADDADEVLRGAAVLAARIMARLAATPSTHAVRVQQLLGLRDGARRGTTRPRSPANSASTPTARAAVIGVESVTPHPRLADVLALSASAFHRDAQVAANGSRVYVLFPHDRQAHGGDIVDPRHVGALHTELGLELRAVIAAPVAGLGQAAAARTEVDRVLDSAGRHPGASVR